MPTTDPYVISGDKVFNDKGEVAVGYYQPIPKRVQLRSGHVYFFNVNYVSMGWIPREDLDEVLAIPFGCCQKKKAGAFFLANENYVRRFLNLELKGR
jgi:hypothetical protein